MSSPNPPISRSRRLTFQLVALLFGLLIIALIGEVVFRLFPQLVAEPPAPPPYNYRQPHDLTGWIVREGYRHEGELRDFKGNAYPLQLSFGKNGFRKWGDPASPKKKVLFLGDSYTACAQTSDDKVFYKILGDSLPIEVFAYGAAGYGNSRNIASLCPMDMTPFRYVKNYIICALTCPPSRTLIFLREFRPFIRKPIRAIGILSRLSGSKRAWASL